MELKEMVLSTLAEIEKIQKDDGTVKKDGSFEIEKTFKANELVIEAKPMSQKISTNLGGQTSIKSNDEDEYLESIKERLLVLFEGLQTTKSEKLASRLEITLNFLEFLLASIDDRLDNKGK